MPQQTTPARPQTQDPSPADDRIKALRLQIARLTEAQVLQAAQSDRQHHALAALSARLHDSDARTRELAAEAAALRAEVAGLRGSTSWRITAPLRGVRQGLWWLRGIRG